MHLYLAYMLATSECSWCLCREMATEGIGQRVAVPAEGVMWFGGESRIRQDMEFLLAQWVRNLTAATRVTVEVQV